jgi:hypothetical protein
VSWCDFVCLSVQISVRPAFDTWQGKNYNYKSLNQRDTKKPQAGKMQLYLFLAFMPGEKRQGQGTGEGSGAGSSLKAVLHTWDGELGVPTSSLISKMLSQIGVRSTFFNPTSSGAKRHTIVTLGAERRARSA